MIGTAAALGIGAALGAGKYISDSASAGRQRELQGQIAKYSPWTGIKPTAVQDANPFGDVLQGAAATGVLNQGLNAATAAPASGAAAAGAGAAAAPGAAGAQSALAAGPQLLGPGQIAATGGQSPWMNMMPQNQPGQLSSPFTASR